MDDQSLITRLEREEQSLLGDSESNFEVMALLDPTIADIEEISEQLRTQVEALVHEPLNEYVIKGYAYLLDLTEKVIQTLTDRPVLQSIYDHGVRNLRGRIHYTILAWSQLVSSTDNPQQESRGHTGPLKTSFVSMLDELSQLHGIVYDYLNPNNTTINKARLIDFIMDFPKPKGVVTKHNFLLQLDSFPIKIPGALAYASVIEGYTNCFKYGATTIEVKAFINLQEGIFWIEFRNNGLPIGNPPVEGYTTSGSGLDNLRAAGVLIPQPENIYNNETGEYKGVVTRFGFPL